MKAVTRPVAILVGGADAEAPPQECAGWLDEQLPNSHLVFLGPEVGHRVFLCESTDLSRRADPIACVDPPGVDRRLLHDEFAALAARLFRT